ncbi:MAG: DUF1848 family protein [Deltaproteobacteria bacterium]|nr:DUF1848 family protein [Deltaproteobacteria bacterium]MBN2672712.1 DUF1848 family protein [Deltaproteobacteria bacterium]
MAPKQLSIASIAHPTADSNTGTTQKPLILSASRRTDLPGFFPTECSDIIRNKAKRLRSRFLYGVVFWTKRPGAFLQNRPLRKLVEELENPLVQLTITGLGGTPLEPGIPPVQHTLAMLPELVRLFKANPQRVRWRFDPLLKQHNGIDDFNIIAEAVAAVGIQECTISFPTYFSLKGNLTSQFNLAGIPKWNNTEKADFVAELTDAARQFNIGLKSCAQPEICTINSAVQPAACIDAALIRSLHPNRLPLPLGKDSAQRKHCLCVASEDIGNYHEHRCGGGCVYCYSKAGGPQTG